MERAEYVATFFCVVAGTVGGVVALFGPPSQERHIAVIAFALGLGMLAAVFVLIRLDRAGLLNQANAGQMALTVLVVIPLALFLLVGMFAETFLMAGLAVGL